MKPDSINDDRLDDLLARASWPQAGREATERLEDRWRRISPAGRGRWVLARLAPLAAAAALVLAGAVVATIVLRDRPNVTPVVATYPSSVHPSSVQVVKYESSYPWRPLTRREELLLKVGSMSPRPAARLPKGSDVIIHGLVSDVVWRPLEFQSPAFRPRFHARAAEHRLLEEIASPGRSLPAKERVEAVRLLAAIGSERSLPALVVLYRDPSTREAALAGVVRLADATTLAMLAVEPVTAAGDRAVLLSAMLRREPELAVRLLIPMIQDTAMFAPAMAALDAVASGSFGNGERRAVIGALFDELRGPRVEDRLAAARALGRIDGPETAMRLAEMAEHNDSRREALAALIWCGGRSAAATAALEAARRSPRLASTVRSLELTLGDVPGEKEGKGTRS
jgi:hypothetical protein